MAAKGRTRLISIAVSLAVLFFFVLSSSSPSPSRLQLAMLDFGDEGKEFEPPRVAEEEAGAVWGGGGVGEGEWEAEESEEGRKGQLGELATSSLNDESAPLEVPPAKSLLTTSPSPPSNSTNTSHPSLPPLSSTKLSVLRRDYLSRLASMETFGGIGMNGTHNERMFGLLIKCLKDGEEGRGRCATEVPRVVVVTELYFVCGLDHCSTTGEVIWLAPVSVSLEKQGHYSLVFEDHDLLYLWSKLGDMITQIWMTDQAMVDCFGDQQHCVASSLNPGGIPPWKLFALTFWGSIPGAAFWQAPERAWSFNPLGSEWTLTPYQMPDNHTYLGYSFEGCNDVDVVPPSERNDSVFVLAKYNEYFNAPEAWPPSLYASLINDTGLELFTTAKGRDEDDPNQLPFGIRTVGRLSKEEYSVVVGSAQVMLGIGRPGISPSPYAALCQGVPVVLPYFKENPLPLGWEAFRDSHQHAIAAQIGPPYVYSVNLNGPMQDLIDTVKKAAETPIGSVPPEMTVKALDARVDALIRTDWEAVARARMEEKGWAKGERDVSLPEHLKGKAGTGRFFAGQLSVS